MLDKSLTKLKISFATLRNFVSKQLYESSPMGVLCRHVTTPPPTQSISRQMIKDGEKDVKKGENDLAKAVEQGTSHSPPSHSLHCTQIHFFSSCNNNSLQPQLLQTVWTRHLIFHEHHKLHKSFCWFVAGKKDLTNEISAQKTADQSARFEDKTGDKLKRALTFLDGGLLLGEYSFFLTRPHCPPSNKLHPEIAKTDRQGARDIAKGARDAAKTAAVRPVLLVKFGNLQPQFCLGSDEASFFAVPFSSERARGSDICVQQSNADILRDQKAESRKTEASEENKMGDFKKNAEHSAERMVKQADEVTYGTLSSHKTTLPFHSSFAELTVFSGRCEARANIG